MPRFALSLMALHVAVLLSAAEKPVVLDVKPDRNFPHLVGALTPALQAAGYKVTGHQVMGALGYAFAFSMNPDGKWTAHWTGFEWGYFLGDLKRIGPIAGVSYSLKGANVVSEEKMKSVKQDCWAKVKASIDQGIPVVVWQAMTLEQWKGKEKAWAWGLIVGYNDADKTYLVNHRDVGKQFAVPHDQFGFTDPVKWFCLLIPAKAPKAQSWDAALETAVDFATGKRNGADSAKASGSAAYAMWADAFEKGTVDLGQAGSHLHHLRQSRVSAVAYLNAIARTFDAQKKATLQEAAKSYAEELKLIDALSEILAKAKKEGLDAHKADAATTIKKMRQVSDAAAAKLVEAKKLKESMNDE